MVAFVIGEAVPFFNDLLALISSLFDSWFGYILWGFAWIHRSRHGDLDSRSTGLVHKLEWALNITMIVTGLFFFGAGTYASVQSIINDVSASLHGPAAAFPLFIGWRD